MEDKVQTILQEATAHLQGKDADAAIECLKQLGDRVLENYHAAYLLGMALGAKRRLDHALSYLSKSVELKPDYVPARYHLAQGLRARGDIPQAIAHLKEVLRQAPQHQPARDLLNQLTIPSSPVETIETPSPAKEAISCPDCGTENPADYLCCSMCGALSAEALKRKDAEAVETERIKEQAAEPEAEREEKRNVLQSYAAIGAIAAASMALEVWWLVIMKRSHGTSIGIALLMMLLTLIVQAVIPFLIGLAWFSLAWWVEDKSKVLRASLMMGAACVIVEIAWRLVIGPTIGVVVSFIPFGELILSFCLYYLAVMFVLEREIHLRLDASYGAALWLSITIMIVTAVGTVAVTATASALSVGSKVASQQNASKTIRSDLPTYPGAQPERKGINLSGLGGSQMFVTNSNSPEEITGYFKSEMVSKGWTLQGEQTVSDSTMLMFSQQARQVQVHVMASERPVKYMVMEMQQQ